MNDFHTPPPPTSRAFASSTSVQVYPSPPHHGHSPSSSEKSSDDITSYKGTEDEGSPIANALVGSPAVTMGLGMGAGTRTPITPDSTPPQQHSPPKMKLASNTAYQLPTEEFGRPSSSSNGVATSESPSIRPTIGLGISGVAPPPTSPPKRRFDPFAPLEPSPVPSFRFIPGGNDSTPPPTISKIRPTSLYIPMEEENARIGKSGNTPTWPFNASPGSSNDRRGSDIDHLFVGRPEERNSSFETDRSPTPSFTGSGYHTPSQGGFESDVPYSPSAKSSPPPSSPAPPSKPLARHNATYSLGTHALLSSRSKPLANSLDTPAAWLCLYFFFNLGLTLFNKLVLQGFPFPWTLTGIQMLSGTVGTQVALKKGFFKQARLTGRESLVMLAFSGLYTINIAVSNLSLHLVTVPFHQVVRATTPIFTIFLSVLLFHKSYSRNIYISLLPVVLGVVFATYGDYYFTPWGLFLTLFGTLLAALKTIVTNKIQVGRLKLHPLDLLIRMSPLAFIQCVLWGWYSGELERVREYGALEMTKGKAVALAMNGFLAFGLNVVSFTANKKTSALTMTVAANVKQVLTIILAVLIFNLVLNPTNLFGIFLTLVGGVVYGRVESMEKARQANKITSSALQGPTTSDEDPKRVRKPILNERERDFDVLLYYLTIKGPDQYEADSENRKLPTYRTLSKKDQSTVRNWISKHRDSTLSIFGGETECEEVEDQLKTAIGIREVLDEICLKGRSPREQKFAKTLLLPTLTKLRDKIEALPNRKRSKSGIEQWNRDHGVQHLTSTQLYDILHMDAGAFAVWVDTDFVILEKTASDAREKASKARKVSKKNKAFARETDSDDAENTLPESLSDQNLRALLGSENASAVAGRRPSLRRRVRRSSSSSNEGSVSPDNSRAKRRHFDAFNPSAPHGYHEEQAEMGHSPALDPGIFNQEIGDRGMSTSEDESGHPTTVRSVAKVLRPGSWQRYRALREQSVLQSMLIKP